MKCPFTNMNCNFPKVHHITNVDDTGNVESIHLCNLCGSQILSTEYPDIYPMQMKQAKIITSPEELKELFDPLLVPDMILDNMPTCSNCGLTLADFMQKQRLGCTTCYKELKEPLEDFFKYYHGEKKHIGKVPKNFKKRKNIKDLEDLISLAISEERYEDAAAFKKEKEDLLKSFSENLGQ